MGKFQLTFKTPDVLDQLRDQIEDEDEYTRIRERAYRHIKWGEYITLEYDDEKDVLTVV